MKIHFEQTQVYTTKQNVLLLLRTTKFGGWPKTKSLKGAQRSLRVPENTPLHSFTTIMTKPAGSSSA